MGILLHFFQSVEASPAHHNLLNMVDNGLGTSAASSLRTFSCISSGPVHLQVPLMVLASTLSRFHFCVWVNPGTPCSSTPGVFAWHPLGGMHHIWVGDDPWISTRFPGSSFPLEALSHQADPWRGQSLLSKACCAHPHWPKDLQLHFLRVHLCACNLEQTSQHTLWFYMVYFV